MPATKLTLRKSVSREALLFLTLLLVGLILLPIAIYVVGRLVFGEYAGTGLTDFLERIYRGVIAADDVVWFLILSPYFGWQVLRLTIWLFRRNGSVLATTPPKPGSPTS